MRALDHVADVGLRIHAPDLETLFDRAAHGMMWLIGGERDEPAGGAPGGVNRASTHDVDITSPDVSVLLVDWLRELLYQHETGGLVYASAHFDALDDRALRAKVTFTTGAPPVREIKGVTYHALSVDRTDGGWQAKVVFDV